MTHGSPAPPLRRVTLGPADADRDVRLMVVAHDFSTTLLPGKVYTLALCPDFNGHAVLFLVDGGPIPDRLWLAIQAGEES